MRRVLIIDAGHALADGLQAAVAARILHLTNSAFFGLPSQVRTIEQALTYAGVQTVKSLVFAAEAFRCFATGAGVAPLPLEEIQDHALLSASIARRMLSDREAAEEAFTAALLHDVGQLVLATRLPEEFRADRATAAQQRRPLHEIEEGRYGVSHAEIGAYLLALWGLPETIVEAIANHHTPMRVEHEAFELLDAVHLASHLAHEQGGAANPDGTGDGEIDPDYVQTLHLDECMPQWRAMAAEQARAGSDQAG